MIEFFIAGIPAPGGSKRYVGKNKRTGRALLIDDAKGNKTWRERVAWTARQKLGSMQPLDVPLQVQFIFYVKRPKGHYNAKGHIKASAPMFPTPKPDVLKLARSTEDALTGIIWQDDAGTVSLSLAKRYAVAENACGCLVRVRLQTTGGDGFYS